MRGLSFINFKLGGQLRCVNRLWLLKVPNPVPGGKMADSVYGLLREADYSDLSEIFTTNTESTEGPLLPGGEI